MKTLFTLLSLFLTASIISAQQFVPLLVDDGADTLNIQHAATAAVDLDDDGTLDILISGDGLGVVADGIFLSNGDMSFTQSADVNVVTKKKFRK